MTQSLDPGRTGRVPGVCPRSAPTSLRYVPAPGGALVWAHWYDSHLLIHGGLAVVPLSNCELGGADLLTGEERWRLDVRALPGMSKSYFYGTPTMTDDGLVVLGAKTHLVAVEAATGALRWKAAIKNAYASPLVAESLCFSNTRDGLVALDVTTGKKRWSTSLAESAGSTSWADGRLYVGVSKHGVSCVEAATGRLLWDYVGPDLDTHATIDGGVAYIGTKRGLSAWDAAGAKELWRSEPLTEGVPPMPKLGEGRAVVRDGFFGSPRAYDVVERRTAWEVEEERKGGVFPWAFPRIWGDAVLLFDASSDLRAFRLSDGALLWQQPLPPEHDWGNSVAPASDADGRLWLAGTQGFTALEWSATP